MYWHKTPIIIQWLYPTLIWHKSRKEKVIYLTFDDGPIPEITPKVLEILNQFNAQATFFCVGDNVRKHPDVFAQVLAENHQVGNHTFDHINGWKTSKSEYLNSVEQCKALMPQASFFRPAYGKMKRNVISKIKEHYQIIMWDVLAGDFDPKLSKEECLSNTIQATKNGSIVIFHDSLKAKENLLYALPRYLEHFCKLGYTFAKL